MICSNPRRADGRFLFFQKWESDTSLLIDPRPPPPKKRDRKKNPAVRGGVKLEVHGACSRKHCDDVGLPKALKEVERYTKAVDRERLARAAMARLAAFGDRPQAASGAHARSLSGRPAGSLAAARGSPSPSVAEGSPSRMRPVSIRFCLSLPVAI